MICVDKISLIYVTCAHNAQSVLCGHDIY